MRGAVRAPADSRGVVAAGRALDRDVGLAHDGWRRRFVGGPPRLQELVELYESLGHEVRVEPLVDDDLGHECEGCSLALALFRIVYTRVPR